MAENQSGPGRLCGFNALIADSTSVSLIDLSRFSFCEVESMGSLIVENRVSIRKDSKVFGSEYRSESLWQNSWRILRGLLVY